MARYGDPLNQLIEDLGKIPPELRRQMRPAMRRAALPILEDAKNRASWSSRIPGAIGIRTSFQAGPRAGVRLVVDAKKAPHARPFEMGSKKNGRDVLRHPVFADAANKLREEWTWVSMKTRPFFFPAARAGIDQAREQAQIAVLRAAREAGGFR